MQDLKVPQNGTFLPRDEEGYGAACGARTLPYRMQDRYTRSSEPVSLPALVLENEHLKATLMPTLGGRLWSLFDKDESRELLFENPVLRVANLGIRPSFDPPKELLEPHFFDFAGDLYGQRIEVELIEFLRPEAKFDGLDALKAQMAHDCERARLLLASS